MPAGTDYIPSVLLKNPWLGESSSPLCGVYNRMQFRITDRNGIEHGIVVRSSYIVISIRDPGRHKASVRRQSGLRGILYLAFSDTEPVASLALPREIVPMTPDHADQIWKFVREHESQVGTIVVHCEQGMSRSPAVAAALCKAMGGDDARFWHQYQPNPQVYRLVMAASGEKASRA